MSNLYQFYEVVKVESDLSIHKEINQSKGVVLGMACNESNCVWTYAVLMDVDELCWSIEEKYLQPTGEFKQREDIY